MNAQVQDQAGSTAVAMKLGDDLALLQPQIEAILPEHVDVNRFMRIVQTAIVTNPSVRNADRRTLFTAAIKAATDGLVPDGREGAFVCYGSTVQWMPMVAGIMKKIRNSGELKSLQSNVVKKQDHFKYWIDDDGEHVQHEPNVLVPDRGETVAVYAIAKTMNGGVYTEVMSRGQIDQIRGVSKAGGSGPWKEWYDEMARKSVIRRLSKRLPMSTDLEQVMQRDDDHYDLNRRNGEAASGGVSAARKVLGLDLTGDQGGSGQASGAGNYVPQYTAETAIAEIKGTTTVAQLEGLAAQIREDFTLSKRDVPVEVTGAIDDHRASLEQAAARAEAAGKVEAGKGKRT